MDHDDTDNSVILLRAAPGSAGALAAQEAAKHLCTTGVGQLLVFFHGPAVLTATRPETLEFWSALSGPVALALCEASWHRRCDHPVPPSFSLSSLVQFWHQALSARQVFGFGQAHV